MALGMECLLGDPTLEEEFRWLKKRDLTETYLFQMACGSFRPQKWSGSAFRKHIMDKRDTFPATRLQPKRFDARPAIPASDLRGAAEFFTRFPGDKPPEHPDWISDRKAFREALDGMGDVRRWLRNKPILSDLEVLITERDRLKKRMSSPPSETSISPPPPPDVTTSSREVEEVKSFLRSREACNLSKFLDWHGTGKIKRVDLCALFKKEGLFIQPERMNVLMSSLKSKDGNSVTVEDLAAGIQAWSGKHQEREEHKSNAGDWNADCFGTRHHLPTHGITLEEKDDEMGMQDEEVLAIMRRVLATTMSSCTSTLNGTMGKEVDRVRKLCFREYQKSIEQCQRQGLNVSQATLQKVLLHPADMSMSSVSKLGGKGHLSGWAGREHFLISARTPKPRKTDKGGANKDCKAMKKQSTRWADPNAFWPGKEDHVRLFLPIMTSSPAMVLFQRIERTVAPSPGHWPVNHLGYSTSGDIEARKIYTL